MIGSILLFLIVFFSPTQYGIHFWIPSSYIAGFRIDYLSPTLYLEDILIITYIIFNLKGVFMSMKNKVSILFPLVVFILLNIVFSKSPVASIFIWSRWLTYLIFIISLHVSKISRKQIILPLSFALGYTVLIEALQFVNQSSLGGAFKLLGERSLDAATPGVAKLVADGRLYLRPYATFSHPNSLAGYLLLSYYLFSSFGGGIAVRFASMLGITLTFSKGAILTLSLYILRALKKNRLVLLIFLPLLVLFIGQFVQSPEWLTLRSQKIAPTLKIISQNPIFGVGLGGYFTSIRSISPDSILTPSYLQPMHNVPLLYFAETGILGVIFIFYLYRHITDKKTLHCLMEPLSLVLLTGGFDHYWLTLPQNKLILLLTLFLVYNNKSCPQNTI